MVNKIKQFHPYQKHKRAFEEIAVQIKEAILRGDWISGEFLPSENQLADQFKVSRATIREALRVLELSGFITIKPGGGGGPFVKDNILAKINELYLDAFLLKDISLYDFLYARLGIEKLILNTAIDNYDEEDASVMEESV